MNANGIIRTFGVVVLLAAVSMQCSKIHEEMSNDEIFNYFHTTRDKIPEYEVALVRHNLYKRSNQNLRMQFTAFGKKTDAYLNPSDGLLMGTNTPVWLAFTKPNGTVEYKKMREGIVGMVVSRFFTSPTDFSSVVVNQTKGENTSFDGIVSGLLVRPLPKRFQEDARFRRNSEASNASRTMLDTHYHVIIKSTSVIEEERIRRLEGQIREASRSGNRTHACRVKHSTKEIIYPTILVQTDFKGSETIRDDLDYFEEIIYQLAFWNAVDLRFRHVNDPKIRLRIAGLIIGQDRNATPFLHKRRKENVIYMDRGVDEAITYWHAMFEREDFKAYHIAVTMTDTDIYRDGKWILGMANRMVCYGPWNSVAVVHDNGGFDGILTATHELGHVLSLDHDRESGGECDASNGFIMAPIAEVGPKNLEWSPCSLKCLSTFMRMDFINCYDQPEEFSPTGNLVQRVLPGDVWGPHKQCQARGYDWACESTPGMCTEMKCFYTYWRGFFSLWLCQNSGPAAEGTLCAPGHKCVDGVCQCMTEDCIFINGTAGS